MKDLRGKIGTMVASMCMMAFMGCTPILASVADTFPDAPVALVQMLTYSANLVSIFASMVAGKLTPYVYKKKLILITGLIYPICGLVIFLYHPSVWFILFMTLLMGIPVGFRVTCISSLICDCYDSKTQARLLGLQGAFISVGAMIFIWVASQLGKVHWERSYLSLLLIFVILIVEGITLPQGKLDKKADKGNKAERAKAKIPKSIVIYTIILLLNGIILATYNNNISMFVDVFGLGGTVEAGYCSSMFTFVGIVGGVITGFAVTRMKRMIWPLGMVYGLIGALLMMFGRSLIPACLAGAFYGWCSSTIGPAGNYFVAQESTEYNRSFCLAFFNAGNGAGMMISTLIWSAVVGSATMTERMDITFRGAVICYAALAVLVFVLMTYLNKTSKEKL